MAAADPFDGGHEEVLSYLHGVAVANQPTDVETGPVMVPVAFAARVSDKDNQDPTLSIPRQLARCREALPPYCVIVAFFWDVESGRTSLDLRGHSDAHELFNVPVPRDGGIADLLEEARHADRRFVAVVCESVTGSPGSPTSARRSSTSWSSPGSRCWPQTKASPPTHSRALRMSWPASAPRRS